MGRVPPLRIPAEALLLEGGGAACLIAWGGLPCTTVLSGCSEMGFVGTAYLDDLVVNGGCRCALGQYMFAAYPLYRLAHHGGGTHIHQQIAHLAHRGVAGNA